MSERDPYTLLGIDRDATREEIRAAFRRAVREHHPDTASAEEDDRDVQSVIDAYRLLIDPRKRARYDSSERSVVPGSGIQEVEVTHSTRSREESRYSRLARCSECRGRGHLVSTRVCSTCHGRAEITALDWQTSRVIRCRTCQGGGQIRVSRPCQTCSGTGHVRAGDPGETAE